MHYEIFPLGDQAVTFSLGERVDITNHSKITAMAEWIRSNMTLGLIDVVIGYQSLTLIFDSFQLRNIPDLQTYLNDLLIRAFNEAGALKHHPQTIRIPVCYEDPFSLDIEEMATSSHISTDEIISLHSSRSYRVFMNGFLPGFAYMGTVDERIAFPRRNNPRKKVQAGSVGIAGLQTGVYPVDSPGGWQIIGRTPLKLFSPSSDPPVLLAPGDNVEFYAITASEFKKLQHAN